jgi:hypothetical protein
LHSAVATRSIGGMNLQVSLRLFLAVLGIAILGACATHPPFGASPLAGTWTNSLGTVWTLKADGTFDVDLKHHGQRDAWGTYTVAGDTVTLMRVGGINPKGCEGKGVYKFLRPDKDSLRFTLVSDGCKMRRKNVTQPWHRK